MVEKVLIVSGQYLPFRARPFNIIQYSSHKSENIRIPCLMSPKLALKCII